MADKSIINYVSSLGSMVTEDIGSNLVFEGCVFTSRQIITIPAGASNLYFNATAVTNKQVFVLPPEFTAIGGTEIIISLYVGATYTAGTQYDGACRDQLSGNSPDSFINFNGTLVTPGVNGKVKWLIPSTAVGVLLNSGKSTSRLPFRINPDYIQRLSINNTDASSQTLEYSLTWFELPL